VTPAAAAGPGGEPSVEARSAELRLARLHLRGGSYALARSELETLAGADRLDPDAVLDLAEVRWRTGDLAGAAAAAEAWLAEGDSDAGADQVVAHVICAEAAAERGRDADAMAHVDAAAPGLGDRRTLEAILAGIVARAAWPFEPDAAIEPTTATGPAAAAAGAAVPGAAGPGAVEPSPAEPGVAEPVLAEPGSAEPAATAGQAAAGAQLARAGAEMLAAAPGRAVVLRALALQADRDAASTVLEALDGSQPSAEHAAAIALVRADALRAAGRHDEARIAYASAERLALEPASADAPRSLQ
jgi:hypothetical protein